MKSNLILSTLAFLAFPQLASAQNVSIPDANFKSILVAVPEIDVNDDDEIQESEAAAFTGAIYCGNSNIEDLTGIEAFTELTGLFCSVNPLGELDLTANTKLTELNVYGCQLTMLEIGTLTALNTLHCEINFLTSIDVSHTEMLVQLYCGDNPNLTTINAANGNNSVLLDVNMLFCPLLTCVQVDDVAFSTANWPNVDSPAIFSLLCGTSAVHNLADMQVTVYPVPATDRVLFSKMSDVVLTDMAGRVVSFGRNVGSLDLSAFLPGAFVLTFSDENGRTVQREKIIKK